MTGPLTDAPALLAVQSPGGTGTVSGPAVSGLYARRMDGWKDGWIDR